MDTKKLKLESLSGISANSATFFSPSDCKSSSSAEVRAARLSKLNFQALLQGLSVWIFNVLEEPE